MYENCYDGISHGYEINYIFLLKCLLVVHLKLMYPSSTERVSYVQHYCFISKGQLNI